MLPNYSMQTKGPVALGTDRSKMLSGHGKGFMMRHIFAFVLCASCASPPQQSAFARVPWLSVEATLAAIEAWPVGASDQAPWAVYVAIPSDLAIPDFDRIHRAIRARGYGAPHSEPSMLDVTTALTARLALADPVGQDFNVSAEVAHLLWLHSIPFTIEAGNSQVITLPRSAVTAASRVLEGVVPVQTRWRR